MIIHVAELADFQIEDWKFRLTGCLCFQFSWSLSRFIALGIVYFCNEWSTVLILITLVIATAYLFLDDLICQEEMKITHDSANDQVESQSNPQEPPFFEAFKTSQVLKANLIILCLTWFTLGVTFYGFLHSWCKISSTHKKFENDVLSAILGAIGEIMALLICIAVKRKNLPFSILLVVMAIGYFVLIATTDAKSSHSNLQDHHDNSTAIPDSFYENTLYVAHIISFLSAAAFAILWTITIEMFPQSYR